MTAYHCNHFITPSPGTSVSIEWGPNVANAHLEGREQAVTVTRATAHPSAVHFFSEANRVREAMANEPSPPPVAERDAAWLAEAVKGSDIGLIAVEEDIDAVPAAVVSFDPLDLGDVVIMGGYGRESVDGPSFARLRFGIKQVAAFRGGTVELPEGDVDGGRSGVAPGDSGGPAYVQDEDGQFVVVGVNSIRDDTFRASSPDGIVPSLVAALSSGPHWPELSVETWFREFVGDDD
jgi:hypothetical protein